MGVNQQNRAKRTARNRKRKIRRERDVRFFLIPDWLVVDIPKGYGKNRRTEYGFPLWELCRYASQKKPRQNRKAS
jgi:hypothetical protein